MKYFDMNVEMPYFMVICVSCVGHGRRRDIVSVHSRDAEILVDGVEATRHRREDTSTASSEVSRSEDAIDATVSSRETSRRSDGRDDGVAVA